jgi:hypothetical protein
MKFWIIAASIILASSGMAEAKGSGGHSHSSSSSTSHSKSSSTTTGYHEVRGYTRKDGTYVAPHYQTDPNGTRNDNWSTTGNVNPFTGKEGTKPRDEDVPH